MQGAALSTLAFTINGVEVWLTPSQAYAQGTPFSVLSTAEVETIEAVGKPCCRARVKRASLIS